VTNPSTDELLSLVGRAHRRVTLQLTLREALLALSVGLAGLTALLAAGTGWFPLPLLWACLLLGIAAGAYRWIRLHPTPYRVAQRLDTAWAANDQISTAYYFNQQAGQRDAITEAQAQLAAASAQGDLAAALPFRVPKTALTAGGLLLLALGLLAVRYGSDPTLSFKPPLAPLRLLAAAPADHSDPQDSQREFARLHPKEPEESAESLTDRGENDSEASREAPPTIQMTPDGDPSGESQPEDGPAPEVEGLSLDQEKGDPLAGEQSEAGGADSGDQNSDSQDAKNTNSPESPNTSSDAERSNDLLSRLRDAFKNLLSALNRDQQPGASEGEKASSKDASQQAGEKGDSAQAGGEEGEEGQEGQGAEGDAASSENGQQAAKGGSQGPGDQPGSQEQAGSSAAGTAEGSKEILAAEQLEAMGEISKLFQKRAEEMSGEVLIETESAHRQALRTPYQPTDSSHSDRGGIVGRDEVPLAYRDFIQTYFENLKKSGKD
jgi:hypothetical protein